ncbi:hypothetical protein MRB53_003135 [Persea americana]|uniref:Uncharacterized protein n=1 Tax=Persea americana TaxID=3435 RepID=A0ACC2MWB9_PERAE|nr:hypothetical protein MRB53_003135 [Persea americana]
MDTIFSSSFAIPLLLAIFIPTLLYILSFAVSFLFSYMKELVSGVHRPPIAGTVFDIIMHFNTFYDYLTSTARKYPTFRIIAPFHDRIFTCDPANIEYVLKTNFSNYSKGEYICSVLKELFGDGIFLADGDRWRHQRKLASYEFSTRNLREFSSTVFRENAEKLAGKVSVAVAASKAFEIQDLLMKSTLDSIFKVGFGVDLNSLSPTDDFGSQFTKAFEDVNASIYWRFLDLFWKLKKFLNIGSEAALKRNVKVMDEFVFRLIQCKRQQMKTERTSEIKEDILSRFLIESEKDPNNMTERYLRDTIFSFIIAGRDSTANTLTWFFYMICKYPLIQDKIAQELKEATKADPNVSISEFAASITEEALENMNYLHATLSETLRLYPVVPVDAKNTDEDDILPDGFRVKKGEMLNFVPYAMGRMTHIWGEDAEEFRPERWLEDGVYRPESPFKFTAFQGGPRICLGKEFAYRQMKIMGAVLLHFFRFKLKDENKEAKYKTRITLHMDQGLHLFAFHRLQN